MNVIFIDRLIDNKSLRLVYDRKALSPSKAEKDYPDQNLRGICSHLTPFNFQNVPVYIWLLDYTFRTYKSYHTLHNAF